MCPSRELAHERRTSSVFALIAASLMLLLGAGPAHALTGATAIDEVMTSYDGDPNVQFVEFRMLLPDQSLVTDTVLAAFDAGGSYQGDVLVVPGDVPNDGPGVRWLIGTAQFATVSGLMPDFVIVPSLPAGGGMVCWGTPHPLPALDATWDRANFNNYIDCVAYGTYSGPSNIHIMTPTPLDADGHSIWRLAETGSNANDFWCGDPAHPTTNDGTLATLPATTPCAGQVERPIAGRKLLIKNNFPDDERANKIVFVAKDASIVAGEIGSSGDPRCPSLGGGAAGGAARFFSAVSGQDHTTSLPCQNWELIGRNPGAGAIPKGYRYQDPELDDGTCKLVTLKHGKQLKAVCLGKGPSHLGYDLRRFESQAPVNVVITAGTLSHCAQFGGQVKRSGDDGRTFKAFGAGPPASCP